MQDSNLEQLDIRGNKIAYFDLGTSKALKELKINNDVVETLVADEQAVIH